MSFPLFLLLPKFAFSFSPFTADRTTSSTISECLCSAVVIGYFGHRCPYLVFFKLYSTLHTGPRAGFHCWGFWVWGFFWTSISFFSFQQRWHRYFCVSLRFQLRVGYPLDWLYFNPKLVTFTEMSFVKLAWKAVLNLKSMLGNRFPWLPFLFFFCQRQPQDLYLQCFFFPPLFAAPQWDFCEPKTSGKNSSAEYFN